MSLTDVLLLFTLYTLVVAAGVALFLYASTRRRRPAQVGLAVPNTNGFQMKSRSEANVTWPTSNLSDLPELSDLPDLPELAEPVVAPQPARLSEVKVEPLSVSPPAVVPPADTQLESAAETPQLALQESPKRLVEHQPYAEPALVSTLAGVFAAAGPFLPEGLRTLEVYPKRVIEPGSTVRAAFTFRNLGGGTGSGFRVRFRLPEGLTYVPGSAHLDESPLEEQAEMTTLLQTSGADIGEIPAGGERRVALTYAVAATIENGTRLMLQAAIASADVPVIGSNIVRLIVNSLPVLQNPETSLVLTPVREALPGEELQLTARIHNSGESSAHDLVVLLPVPAHTTFSPQSVTVAGRPFAQGSESVPFGFARPTVVAPTLPPGASIDVRYRVRIDSPLEDATRIVAQGAVCSLEVAEFALPSASIRIPSAASFADDDTSLLIECTDEVEPGESVRIVLHAKNVGTAAARKLSLRVALPEGMLYTAGSLGIDGAAAPDRGLLPDAIRLGDLEPGRSVELTLSAIVLSPIANGHELRVTAIVAWSKGQRKFDRTLTARSAPHFPANFNKLERETSRRVGPGEPVAYTIALLNMGTDIATDVRLQLTADEGLERLRVHDRDTEIVIGDGGTIALDPLEPGVSRLLRVEGRIASVIEDQSQLRLQASLLTTQVARVELGTRAHIVESRPLFSVTTSYIAVDSDEALRLKHMSSCRVLLTNEGTDCGRDVRLTLLLPDEMRLETVDGADHDGKAVIFGDIPAGETRAAVVNLRLVGSVSAGEFLTIAARVGGLNIVPFNLSSIELATHAQASFAEGALLSPEPAQAVDAGAPIAYTLSLNNSGDGLAKSLNLRVVTLTNAVYAQGSTTINGIPLQDFGGRSPLWSDEGLRLADVGAGVEVVARWSVIVNVPLPPTSVIETAVAVHCDDVPAFSVVAPPVRVRSTSALPIIEPKLPFSVLGAVAAPARAASAATRTALTGFGAGYLRLGPAGRPDSSPNGTSNTAGSGANSISTIPYVQLTSGNKAAPEPVEQPENHSS